MMRDIAPVILGGFIGTAVVVVIMVPLMLLGSIWESYRCDQRWSTRNSEYSISTGCMVEWEGELVPEERVWFERNK